MNILYVIPYFNPKRGGDVNVCTSLSKELVKKGHRITIITTDFEFDEEYITAIKKQGINVVYFKSKFNFGLLIYSPEMKKWLDNNLQSYDIVHLHTFRSYQNILLFNYCKKYDVPYIIQAHGSLSHLSKNKILKKFFDFRWGNKILNSAFKVIALTKYEKDQCKNMNVPEEKIVIIPNGINIKEYDNLPKKGEFRNKYSILEKEKIILYLGRINKIKGIDLLLDSFAELSKDIKNVKLVIAGPDDGYLNKIKKKANLLGNEKILIIGPIFNREKLEVYVDADVYVLPSVYETFPMTVLESLACGTPVIITERCGISNIINNSDFGKVIDYDKSALINSINHMLYFKKMKNKTNNIPINFIQDQFNLINNVEKLEKIYFKA